MRAQSLLQMIDFSAGYGEIDILHGLNLKVEKNEIVSIVGPNGAGKTTALKGILGLLHISKGKILLDGEDITGMPPNQVITHGISYVPQTNNVFINLSVEENLEIGAWTRKSGVQARIDEMYHFFPDLKRKRKDAAGTLSGGQRQMVAMAKALMIEAKLLMLDEPTAGLSPKYRHEIFENVKTIKKTGVPILMIEQNAKQALSISDRSYVLVDGRNKVTGTGAELLANREVARMFLGGKD